MEDTQKEFLADYERRFAARIRRAGRVCNGGIAGYAARLGPCANSRRVRAFDGGKRIGHDSQGAHRGAERNGIPHIRPHGQGHVRSRCSRGTAPHRIQIRQGKNRNRPVAAELTTYREDTWRRTE